MASKSANKTKIVGFIFTAVVLAAVAGAVVIAWHYHVYVFKKTARQIPPVYKKQIEGLRLELVKFFPFTEENALKEWEEKLFKGKVVYTIEKGQDLSYVKAISDNNASALYYKIDLDVKTKHPVISWKWNVDKFPAKKNPETLESMDELDFAGRVYVIFLAKFILNSKVLEYVWSETIPAGTIATSPYSKNIKLVVARSGPNTEKKWYYEERDVLADYYKAFGKYPERNIGAVSFMTNTEHTGTSAVSMYDDIRLGYKEDNDPIEGGNLEEKIAPKKSVNY